MRLEEQRALTEFNTLLDFAQKSNDFSSETLGDIITSLRSMAEKYQKSNYRGVSDALVLLAELIDPLQHDELSITDELLSITGKGLNHLVNSPKSASDPLLSCLIDNRWPRPLVEFDPKALTHSLKADLWALADRAEKDSLTPTNAPKKLSNGLQLLKLCQQMQVLLKSHKAIKPMDAYMSEKLIFDIHRLSESCSDLDYLGFSDLFAFYAEFIQQEDSSDYSLSTELCKQLHDRMTRLTRNPTEQAVGAVIAIMTCDQWADPLPESDLYILLPLLNKDCKRLLGALTAYRASQASKKVATAKKTTTQSPAEIQPTTEISTVSVPNAISSADITVSAPSSVPSSDPSQSDGRTSSSIESAPLDAPTKAAGSEENHALSSENLTTKPLTADTLTTSDHQDQDEKNVVVQKKTLINGGNKSDDQSDAADQSTNEDAPYGYLKSQLAQALSTQQSAAADYDKETLDANFSESIIDEFQLLAESCNDHELIGFADAFALYAELIETQGNDALTLRIEIAKQLHSQLSLLLDQPTTHTIEKMLQSMGDPRWSQPLDGEDIKSLRPLLHHDLSRFIGSQAAQLQPSTSPSSTQQSTSLSEFAEPLDAQTNATEVDNTNTDSVVTLDTAEAAVSNLSAEAEVNNAQSNITSLQQQLRECLNKTQFLNALEQPNTDELIDQLDGVAEACSETELVGFADLLALFSQCVESSIESADTQHLKTLHQQLVTLISDFSQPTVDQVLALMTHDCWSELISDEDIAFMQPLLYDDCAKISVSNDAISDPQVLNQAEIVSDSVEDKNIEPEEQSQPVSLQLEAKELQSHNAEHPSDSQDTKRTGNETPDEAPQQLKQTLHLQQDQHPIQPAEHIATPIKPSFLEVDFGLLTEPPTTVDSNVVGMLQDSMTALADLWQDQDHFAESSSLEQSANQLNTYSLALNSTGLLGARHTVDGLLVNVQWLSENPASCNAKTCSVMHHCLRALIAQMEDMTDKSRRDDLVDHCAHLPCAPTLEEAAFLNGLLALASIQDPSEIERKTATDEEVSLNSERDIDPELMSMLYTELPQLSDEFSRLLQALTDERSIEALRDAQRTAHTIKGLANMAGIRGLSNMTHYLEDILELLTDAEALPNQALCSDLMDASDCLADMCESITDNKPTPDSALGCLQQIFDWHYQAKTQGVQTLINEQSTEQLDTEQPIPPAANANLPNESAQQNSSTQPTDDHQEQNQDHGQDQTSANVTEQQATLPDTSPAEAQPQATLSVSVALLDNLFRLAGENATTNNQLDEELTQLRRLTRTSRDRYRAMEQVMEDFEQHLNEYSYENLNISDNHKDFDSLEMDRYNELHSSISRLRESAADINDVSTTINGHIHQLIELHSAQSGLQKESLDTIVHTRMVPVSTISARIQRIVRQACRATDKKANLVIKGEQVMVDSQILTQLTTPLMHIIRNAVDHGLETPHARFEIDKPEVGTITLEFQRDNDQLLITCEDDGTGIDTGRVRKEAQNKGIISADAKLTEREIQRLILLPGFSTREKTSHLSGRGIGMDIVNQQITQLHGTLNLESTQAQGTRIEISLPPSSLMIRVLLVRTGQQLLALSTRSLEQSLLSIDGRFDETDEGEVFITEERSYPCLSIESLVGKSSGHYQSDHVHPVLIVKLAQNQEVAIKVNEIVAHRELIFKEMGAFIPTIPGIPGLTILANGSVAAVIDLPARIQNHHTRGKVQNDLIQYDDKQSLPKVLVVDDSISARKSLINLLQDIGYEVDSAIDGIDALNKIRKNSPDLILTDYEMPRMTGVELASSVTRNKDTDKIPVIMISSRSTHKHKSEAQNAGVKRYITKPWTETQLLGVVEELLQH